MRNTSKHKATFNVYAYQISISDSNSYKLKRTINYLCSEKEQIKTLAVKLKDEKTESVRHFCPQQAHAIYS